MKIVFISSSPSMEELREYREYFLSWFRSGVLQLAEDHGIKANDIGRIKYTEGDVPIFIWNFYDESEKKVASLGTEGLIVKFPGGDKIFPVPEDLDWLNSYPRPDSRPGANSVLKLIPQLRKIIPESLWPLFFRRDYEKFSKQLLRYENVEKAAEILEIPIRRIEDLSEIESGILSGMWKILERLEEDHPRKKARVEESGK